MKLSTMTKIARALDFDIRDLIDINTIVSIYLNALSCICCDDHYNWILSNFLKNDEIITVPQIEDDDRLKEALTFDNSKINNEYDYAWYIQDNLGDTNIASELDSVYEFSLDTSEILFHDMLLRLLKKHPEFEIEFAHEFKANSYYSRINISQVLRNSDLQAQSPYLVNLFKSNLPLNETTKKNVEKILDSLNIEGQQKAIEFLELFAQIPKYQADNTRNTVNSAESNCNTNKTNNSDYALGYLDVKKGSFDTLSLDKLSNFITDNNKSSNSK
jgi:hypothetical protein